MYGIECVDRQSAELRRMYVAPQARRRGLARAMLVHAERLCREAGFHTLILSTSELQKGALALYRASGFQLVREEVASTRTNKTVGAGLRRFHFEKTLTLDHVEGRPELRSSVSPDIRLTQAGDHRKGFDYCSWK